MNYFDGIQWIVADRIPHYEAWLPRWNAPYYALNFARSGRIRWAAGDRRPVVLYAPLAWWTWPGQEITYGQMPGESWDHAYVNFTGPRVQTWLEGGLFSTDVSRAYVAVHEPAVFRQRMDELVRLVQEAVHQPDWMVSLLESLLVLCADEGGQRATPVHDHDVAAVIRDIQTDPGVSIDWRGTARALGLSLVHFRRLFKAYTGCAPHQYLIQARMQEAARRLRSTPQPIKQIAKDLGCSNTYYFTKLFKDRFGLPPAQYRKESRLTTH